MDAINVPHLRDVIERLSTALDITAYGLAEMEQQRADYESDLRSRYGV